MLRATLLVAFVGLLADALPAYALDCASPDLAGDPVASAICSDPALKQADQALNDAYQSLYRGRDKEHEQVVKLLQREWLVGDRGACVNNKKVDSQCLLTAIEARTKFLVSADDRGPANQGKLVFKGFVVEKKKDGDSQADVALFEFLDPDTPGKKSFNTTVDKILADAKSTIASAYAGCGCELTVRMGQPFQTDKFINVPVDTWSYQGGAHGTGYTVYVNQLLEETEPLSFGDMFQEYDASVMAKQCYDQIMASRGDLMNMSTGDETDGTRRPSNTFMQAFRDPATWGFDGETMTVTFSTYVLGSYVDSEQFCQLPYDDLTPLLSDRGELPVAAE